MRGRERERQDRTGQDRTGQHSTAQHRTGQDRAGQGRAGQGRAGQDRTGQDRTNTQIDREIERERDRLRASTTFRSISGFALPPCITTTHPSYSFLSLKLLPPPCAVRLVCRICIVCIYVYTCIYV